MDHTDFPVYESAGRGSFAGLLLLAALLVCVFFLAMGAYGYFAEMGDGAMGELPGAVLVLRQFALENEAVSVFLGLSPVEEVMAPSPVSEEILAKAEAYIREKEGW